MMTRGLTSRMGKNDNRMEDTRIGKERKRESREHYRKGKGKSSRTLVWSPTKRPCAQHTTTYGGLLIMAETQTREKLEK